MSDRARAAPTRPKTHDSAFRHAPVRRVYIDDLPEPAGLLQ